jgi:two-component system, OmpR family, phosphate regulon sensor histidine kinase PhoR
LKRVISRTLLALAAVAAVSFALALINKNLGWGTACVGLTALVLYHALHLAQLLTWLKEPVPGKVPEGWGSWDEVLSALHRFERESVKREGLLAEALARFRRAAQALPDGVVILDGENRIEWCNRTAEAHLNIDGRADLGQPIGNLVREPAFLDYLATPDDPAAVRIARGSGSMLSLQLIPYGHSQKLLLTHDMTQAERVERMRRDFVANVSHELRTPLTVLFGFLETVRELKLDAQRTQDYLAMMHEQATRMRRIIDDLLTLSTLESAPPPPDERVRTAPLLKRLAADAAGLSGGRHSISAEGRPRMDLVGSGAELASAFGNLVSNAIRYTPAGGKVRLAWRDGPDGAELVVEDSGVGIEPEHIPRLTERFYRVDRSRSRETGGTGLGLAIVKHALARHQASLDIESKPGAGSRFIVRFPPQRLLPGELLGAANRNQQ